MPKLLVIGAGTAGCSAIVGLRSRNKDCEIVLVEPKDHLEAFWATYRSPFDASVRNSSLMVLAQWTKKHKVRHIRSTVTKLDTKSALLANGEEVTFDVVVLCTGANIPSLGRDQKNDGTKESRMEFLKQLGEDCLSAKSVVVVGGGLVGIELIGDIAVYGKRSQKEIQLTLVHSGPFLSHGEVKEGCAAMMQRKLEKLGITVILGERLNKEGEKHKLSNSGETISAEKVIWTVGLESCNDFCKDISPEALDERGFLQTDEYFQVKGTYNVYAFGDCSTYLPCAGLQYLNNIGTIGRTLHAALTNQANKKRKGWQSPTISVATIGPSDGVAHTDYFYSQWLLPTVKNRTMWLFHTRMELGLK